MTILANVLYIK